MAVQCWEKRIIRTISDTDNFKTLILKIFKFLWQPTKRKMKRKRPISEHLKINATLSETIIFSEHVSPYNLFLRNGLQHCTLFSMVFICRLWFSALTWVHAWSSWVQARDACHTHSTRTHTHIHRHTHTRCWLTRCWHDSFAFKRAIPFSIVDRLSALSAALGYGAFQFSPSAVWRKRLLAWGSLRERGNDKGSAIENSGLDW